MVSTMPPKNDGASKCRQLGAGVGAAVVVVVDGVVDVVGAGVVEVLVV